jgi:hypothetical protein
MPQSPGRLSCFWNELKRRKILRSLAIEGLIDKSELTGMSLDTILHPGIEIN